MNKRQDQLISSSNKNKFFKTIKYIFAYQSPNQEKMMNVKNFHLKSAFLNFNSETLNNDFNKDVIKSSKQKINRCIPKTSDRVEMLMKNFKLASKNNQVKENVQKNQPNNNTHFDFQPPTLQSRRNKTVNNLSCTLSPGKSTQKLSSFQLYKTGFKENSHKRRFSDTSFLKSRREKGINKTKQVSSNPQGYKAIGQNISQQQQNSSHLQFQTNRPQHQFQINQYSSRIYGFNKSSNKIKVFQIDNYFNHNQDQKVIHSSKNSSFVSTLPTKRKSFRTVRSSSLKQRRSNPSISLEKTKQQLLQIQTKMSSSHMHQKYEDFKRSIHTAGSVTARKIDLDKTNFTPISAGFFPQSSIWQKEQQFNKHSQTKSRTYRVKEKQSPSKNDIKQKDNSCRPWSPGRPEINRTPFEDEEQFPCIKQE